MFLSIQAWFTKWFWHLYSYVQCRLNTKVQKDYALKLTTWLSKNEVDPPYHGAMLLFASGMDRDGRVAMVGTPLLVGLKDKKLVYAHSHSKKTFPQVDSVEEAAKQLRENYKLELSFGWTLKDPNLRTLQHSLR